MMPLTPVVVLSVVLATSGCAYLKPIHVICKGKGTLSVIGGPYAGQIVGDCPEGFEYKRSVPE